jgi:hypothetical protein
MDATGWPSADGAGLPRYCELWEGSGVRATAMLKRISLNSFRALLHSHSYSGEATAFVAFTLAVTQLPN